MEQAESAMLHAGAEAFVAADVGGTNARVGLVRAAADGSVQVLAYRRYPCAAYPGLDAILAEFMREQRQAGVGDAALARMAIASAGVLLDGEVVSANLPWRISLRGLREGLALRDVHVINDFFAAAHGACGLAPSASRLLTPGVDNAEPGPALVVGPGTGLGAAICVPQDGATLVLPTEAGMAAFAPGNEREIAVLRWLRQRGPHVCNEQLLSGPGLVNLHHALCALDGHAPRWQAPDAISRAAREGDAVALEAVLAFCAALGGMIGDLVLVASARSVHVAGGIVPQLVDFLPRSDFHARLVDKGPMRAVLARVPVRLVENERLGVLGAAAWYLQRG